ncbi:hypothetical protein N431DRAFT_450579 [Stipitochalara longipes BDJ]|nr:hypothetical protein N431DRAFT_450579 [Stipitochalara longipes BDJ]
METVEDEIVTKILDRRSKPDFQTKLDGLSALVGIIKSVVSLPQYGAWSSSFYEGPLPKALMSALVKVGKRLSDTEIDRVREEQELFAALESVTTFAVKRSGERTFKDIIDFQGLFIQSSTVLDFAQCSIDVDELFATEPLTQDQFHTPKCTAEDEPEPRDTLLREVVERITTTDLSWKLNPRSCFKTKVNAFKVLTKIGHTFVRVRRRRHAEAFEDGVLEKILTDTMEKICSFTIEDSDDSTPVGYSFFIDEEFMWDIMDLNITRKGSLPNLRYVFRSLDIPDDSDYS